MAIQLQTPKTLQDRGVAHRLQKRSLLIAVNLVAGLSIFFFGKPDTLSVEGLFIDVIKATIRVLWEVSTTTGTMRIPWALDTGNRTRMKSMSISRFNKVAL